MAKRDVIRDVSFPVKANVRISIDGSAVLKTVCKWFDLNEGMITAQKPNAALVVCGVELEDHEVWILNGTTANLVGTLKSDLFKSVSKMRKGSPIILKASSEQFEWLNLEWEGKLLEGKGVSAYDLGARASHVFEQVEEWTETKQTTDAAPPAAG